MRTTQVEPWSSRSTTVYFGAIVTAAFLCCCWRLWWRNMPSMAHCCGSRIGQDLNQLLHDDSSSWRWSRTATFLFIIELGRRTRTPVSWLRSSSGWSVLEERLLGGRLAACANPAAAVAVAAVGFLATTYNKQDLFGWRGRGDGGRSSDFKPFRIIGDNGNLSLLLLAVTVLCRESCCSHEDLKRRHEEGRKSEKKKKAVSWTLRSSRNPIMRDDSSSPFVKKVEVKWGTVNSTCRRRLKANVPKTHLMSDARFYLLLYRKSKSRNRSWHQCEGIDRWTIAATLAPF